MKNTSVSFLFLFVMLSSCTREYSCRCTSSGSVNGFPVNGSEITKIKGKKKEAEAECRAGSGSVSMQGVNVSTSCGLI